MGYEVILSPRAIKDLKDIRCDELYLATRSPEKVSREAREGRKGGKSKREGQKSKDHGQAAWRLRRSTLRAGPFPDRSE